MTLQPGKRTGRQTHGHCRANAEHGHQYFQPGIQQNRLLQAIGPAPEQPAAESKPGEKRADAGGDRIDLDADQQRELFDPQHLIDQRGRAGDA